VTEFLFRIRACLGSRFPYEKESLKLGVYPKQPSSFKFLGIFSSSVKLLAMFGTWGSCDSWNISVNLDLSQHGFSSRIVVNDV
jgi:hypothetical protein